MEELFSERKFVWAFIVKDFLGSPADGTDYDSNADDTSIDSLQHD